MSYCDDLQKIVDEQSAPMRKLTVKADGEIQSLQKQLSQAQAEIKRLRDARCPECNSPLPADGKCLVCMCQKTMIGCDAGAYRRGMEDLALAIAASRDITLGATRHYAIIHLINSVAEQIGKPDKIAVAKAAAISLSKSGKAEVPDAPRDQETFSKLVKVFGLG